MSLNTQWYVLYTRSRHEKKVYEELQFLDITAYLPLHKVVRQWSDRKKRVIVPLIPNYVFVKVQPNERWKPLTITGTIDYVKFNGSPAIIPEKDIELIGHMSQENVHVSDKVFNNNDRVIVTAGPFKDLEGIVIQQNGKTKLAILLESIKTTFVVEVSTSYLEPVPTLLNS